MKGFDAEFPDLDTYIRVITARIWEGRRLADIDRYYSDPCTVETPTGVTTTAQQVIDGTAATLAMFPDRRLLAEDIIFSGDEDGGFLSSHRIVSTMTHRGDGAFGPATGRRVHVRTVADCVCRDNRVVHEWLVRDQGAIARQLGMQPADLAQRWLDERGGWHKPVAGPPPAGYHSHVSTAPPAVAYAEAVRGFSTGATDVAAAYDDAVHHLGPGETTRYGHDEVGAWWRGLFTVFAVEHFAVEHLVLQQGDGRADRIAMRWRALARHAGEGAFGAATGHRVEILGINHAELFRGRVLREWVLVDEVALWMQVLGGQR
jgi:predicted ester cyclase